MDNLDPIRQKIYEIRGQRVMLDFDLAYAYGVDTSQLKRQVRRNIERLKEKTLCSKSLAKNFQDAKLAP